MTATMKLSCFTCHFRISINSSGSAISLFSFVLLHHLFADRMRATHQEHGLVPQDVRRGPSSRSYATEQMQRRYSTVYFEEQRAALAKVVQMADYRKALEAA